tara:strand:+ start:40 stop:288 length:249 start_codon:yes stop_codon:yes gene_type:complete
MNFKQSRFKLLPSMKWRSSEWVKYILPDVKNGTCLLETKDGNLYEYTNVSRRAMLNLRFNPNMSFGFWANQNLVNSDRAVLV